MSTLFSDAKQKKDLADSEYKTYLFQLHGSIKGGTACGSRHSLMINRTSTLHIQTLYSHHSKLENIRKEDK
jgi:hypothetical protein